MYRVSTTERPNLPPGFGRFDRVEKTKTNAALNKEVLHLPFANKGFHIFRDAR
jgi:hypothetical protein